MRPRLLRQWCREIWPLSAFGLILLASAAPAFAYAPAAPLQGASVGQFDQHLRFTWSAEQADDGFADAPSVIITHASATDSGVWRDRNGRAQARERRFQFAPRSGLGSSLTVNLREPYGNDYWSVPPGVWYWRLCAPAGDPDCAMGTEVRRIVLRRERLPVLTQRVARLELRRFLVSTFGNAFRHGYGYHPRCRREQSTLVSCRFSWNIGDVNYKGSAPMVYARKKNGAAAVQYFTENLKRYTVVIRTNEYCVATGGRDCAKKVVG